MSMNDNNRDILLSALMAADTMSTSVAGAQFVQQVAPKVIKNGLDTEKLKKASIGVGMGSCAGFLLASDFIPTLAQLIDRAWTKKAPVIAEAVEEVLPEVVEEPAVETVAPVVQEAENEEDDEDESFGFSTAGLEFFDAVENPEKYAELQAQEKEGLIKIVTRYRRSFASRLVQSQGDVQEYYSVIKNKLLSYKGVKGRISWGNESFNKGRSYIAKVSAKSKTLYLYLALDPATLENDTYSFEDVSAKKKYENVPVLVKIKGPRKLKYALELIEKICDQNLSLPAVKDFEEENYALPYQSTEELVKLGLVKKMVAGMPVAAFDTTVAPSETDVDVTLA